MHTIKPIDKDALKKINKNYKLLITIEEHSLMGDWVVLLQNIYLV